MGRWRRCCGIGFVQGLGTFFAADLNGPAADFYLDAVGVQLAITGSTGRLDHDVPPVGGYLVLAGKHLADPARCQIL